MTFTRSVSIGSRTATLMLSDAGEFRVSWSPSLPGALSAAELAQYLDHRNKLVGEMRSALAKNNSLTVPYARSEWTDDA